MSKTKHESTGLTPEPASRKSRTGGNGGEKDEEIDHPDIPVNDPMTRLAIEELQAEMAGYKNETAYLMAQHADSLREKAKREILIGGWSSIAADGNTPEEQGLQLEAQAESRERFIKDLAKRAGLSSYYYQDWRYSHQTRGDALSPLTVVTVTQPWQRSKLLDYTKNKLNADKLKEKHYVEDRVETNFDTVQKYFGPCQDKDRGVKDIRVQPQVSLWDRTTGLPLKVAMAVAEMWGINFRHNWRDHTLTTKDGEYIMWCHYKPASGNMTIYLSKKLVENPDQFQHAMVEKFNDMLNQAGRSRKGNGKGKSRSATEGELTSFPSNYTSHSCAAKFPFTLSFVVVSDESNHWGVWKDIWDKAMAQAHAPYEIQTLPTESF
eukprot:Skav207423  [mRNA]  locus=scaffold646:276451:277584:- [translate_table: standard]